MKRLDSIKGKIGLLFTSGKKIFAAKKTSADGGDVEKNQSEGIHEDEKEGLSEHTSVISFDLPVFEELIEEPPKQQPREGQQLQEKQQPPQEEPKEMEAKEAKTETFLKRLLELASERKKIFFIAGGILGILVVIAAAVIFLFGDIIFDDGKFHVGYVICCTEDTFQGQILEAAKAEAGSRGMVMHVKDAEEDVELQTEQISQLIGDRVDALIVVLVDTTAADPIMEAAQAAKIPLVFVNRNPFAAGKAPEGVCFIGSRESLAGELQASYLTDLMPQGGGVAILGGRQANDGTLKRTEGVENILSERPEFRILAKESAGWQKELAAKFTETWMLSYGNELKAVLANNDEMALGAAEVLEAEGRQDVIVMGVDAIPEAIEAVKNGRMDATVMQDWKGQGVGAVKLAAKMSEGEKVKKQTMLKFELVTRENL